MAYEVIDKEPIVQPRAKTRGDAQATDARPARYARGKKWHKVCIVHGEDFLSLYAESVKRPLGLYGTGDPRTKRGESLP